MSKDGSYKHRPRAGNPKLEDRATRLAMNLLLDVAGKKKRLVVFRRDEETGNLVEEVSGRALNVRYLATE